MNKTQIILLCVAATVLVATLFVWERSYWKSAMAQWAGRNSFILVSFHGAKLLENPLRWLRGLMGGNENEVTFRAKVRHQDGATKEGWITFSCWYPFAGPPRLIDEKWD